MEEEEFVAASPTPSDLKQKREDLDEADAKRLRLDENPDGFAVAEDGFEEEKVDDVGLPSAENYIKSVDAKEPTDEAVDTENDKQPSPEDAKVPQAAVVYSEEQEPAAETETVSRKMEVPFSKVGVLIGKQGETLRFLQIHSGAKIQIARDADVDRYSTTRPAELIGTLENINKAERLIKDLIDEADGNIQSTGAAELIKVPNKKVGLIIGKNGETLKNLMTRSGARIQLTPEHHPDGHGDQSKERIVRVSGDKKQIEMAREMIKEVMNQTY